MYRLRRSPHKLFLKQDNNHEISKQLSHTHTYRELGEGGGEKERERERERERESNDEDDNFKNRAKTRRQSFLLFFCLFLMAMMRNMIQIQNEQRSIQITVSHRDTHKKKCSDKHCHYK